MSIGLKKQNRRNKMLRKIALFTLIISCLSMYSYADYYVTYHKSSKEVVDISKDTSCAMPEDTYEKAKVSGDYYGIRLLYAPKFYKYKNKKLELNNKKIQDDFKDKQDKVNASQEELMITQYLREFAFDAIEASGIYTFQFISKEEE